MNQKEFHLLLELVVRVMLGINHYLFILLWVLHQLYIYNEQLYIMVCNISC